MFFSTKTITVEFGCNKADRPKMLAEPPADIVFDYTVRPATALFLVPGIYSAIENSVNGGSCYLVSCKFLQMIVL